MEATPARRRRLSQPRVAEVIADELRSRIVNGKLADQDLLPRQEDLVQEFGVSLPSLREAMRILETEGLISVRRGNVGGAVVHRPTPQAAAFMLGLVLQSHKVVVSDLGAALRVVEPACARMCAERTSRRSIAGRLRALVQTADRHFEEGAAFSVASREFHDELVRSCGNETMRQVVGTLETLWEDYESRWLQGHGGTYPDLKRHQLALDAHDEITTAIRAGDGEAAERACRRHLEQTQKSLLEGSGNEALSITRLRGHFGSGF